MNGHTLPAAIIAGLAVLAGAIAENVEPVLTFIGGGAAVGAAFYNAYELATSDAPDFGRSTGIGGIAGALLGGVVLLADAFVGG